MKLNRETDTSQMITMRRLLRNLFRTFDHQDKNLPLYNEKDDYLLLGPGHNIKLLGDLVAIAKT